MTYRSVNSLQDFEFHDAWMKFVSFQNGQLVVTVKNLNIHKGTEQNDRNEDMEIAEARITFENFLVKRYENLRAQRLGEDGKYRYIEPEVIYADEAAHGKWFSVWDRDLTILSCNLCADGKCCIEFDDRISVMFTVWFNFDLVTVEWDEFNGPAWYVR